MWTGIFRSVLPVTYRLLSFVAVTETKLSLCWIITATAPLQVVLTLASERKSGLPGIWND